MPDLSRQAVEQFWQANEPALKEILLAMEVIESRVGWPVDSHPGVEAALKRLGDDMEAAVRESTLLGSREEMVFVLAYLRSGRAVRIMQWLDERYEGMAYKLMETMVDGAREGNFDATVMIDRITMLRRIRHIGRVFSSSKVVLVLRLLEQLSIEKERGSLQ